MIIKRRNEDGVVTVVSRYEFQLNSYISYDFNGEYATICNVTNPDVQIIPCRYIGIIFNLDLNSLSVLLTLYDLVERFAVETNTQLRPIIYNDKNDPELRSRYMKELINNKLVVVIFGGYNPNMLNGINEHLKNTDKLFFYTGYYVENLCLKNLIYGGTTYLSLTHIIYLNLVNDDRRIFLLYENNYLSNELIYQFDSLFKSVGLLHNITRYDDDSFYKEMEEMKEYCDLYGCVIIFCTSDKLSIYEDLYNYGFRYTDDIDAYTFFITENDFVNNRYIIENITVISTFFSGLIDTDYSFLKEDDKLFISEFYERTSRNYLSNYRTESLYISFKIWKNAVIKLNTYDSEKIRKTLYEKEYESQSGTVYFGDDNSLERRLFTATVTSERYFKVKGYNSFLSTEKIYKPELVCNISEIANVNKVKIIGYIADFDDLYKSISQTDVLLLQQLIYDYNILKQFNGYSLELKVVNLNNNEEDEKKLLEDLFNLPNLVAIFGCNSWYSYYASSTLINSVSVPIFSNLIPRTNSMCEIHMFRIEQGITEKIPLLFSYMGSSGLTHIYFIWYNYDDGHINRTVYNMINENSELHNISVNSFLLNINENNSVVIESYLKEFKSIEDSNYVIFCALYGDDLLTFIKYYIELSIRTTRNTLVLAYFHRFQIPESYVKNLNGSVIIQPFYSDESQSSLSFTSYISSKLSSSASLSLAYTYSQFNGFINAVTLSLSAMKGDHVNDDWPSFDYMRVSIQNNRFDSPLGIIEGSTSNRYSVETCIIQILNDGSTVKILSKLSTTYKPKIISENGEECFLGTTPKYYEYNKAVYITVCVLSGLMVFGLIFSIIFIQIHIHLKTIRFSSPLFLQFINIMGILTIISVFFTRLNTYSSTECTLYYGLLFQIVLMFTSALVLKVYRVHLLLTNKKLKKVSITDKQIFSYIILFSVVHGIILLLWGLIDNFVKYSEPIFQSKATYINIYVLNKCTFNIYYLLFEFIILYALLLIGIYFSWTTRTAMDAFNESRSLATATGMLCACSIIIIVIEILVNGEPDALLFLETGGISFTAFFVCALMIVPKIWSIYILHQNSQTTKSKSPRKTAKKSESIKIAPAPPTEIDDMTREDFDTENRVEKFSKISKVSKIQYYKYVPQEENKLDVIVEERKGTLNT